MDNYFKQYNITNIPKAIIIYKTMSLITAGSMLVLCYKYRPARLFKNSRFGQYIINSIKSRYPNQIISVRKYVKDKLIPSLNTSNQFLNFQVNKRFTYAMMEFIVIGKLCLPITIPIQLWLTYKILKDNTKHQIDNNFINIQQDD
jgi:hypothetical protein